MNHQTDNVAELVGLELSGSRYLILAKLGEGGMGHVYRARDRNLDTDVVIKVPRRSMLEDPEFAGRFSREIRSLVQLAHPQIVKITDVGQHEGVPFAVMQYLAGGSLEGRKQTRSDGEPIPQEPEDLASWLPGIAAALDFIHQQGYVHRDVKPANILFDAHGNAYLSDFGIAKALATGAKASRSAASTGAGLMVGTPEYMAPELIMGEPYDGRADQYALAVTIFEMLTSRCPFEGPPYAIIAQQQTQQPTALHELRPSVATGVSLAVQKSLSKKPKQRYPDCTSLAQAILGACRLSSIGGLPPSARTNSGADAVPAFPQPITVYCPACRKPLRLREDARGKRMRCPACNDTFSVTRDAAGSGRAVYVETRRIGSLETALPADLKMDLSKARGLADAGSVRRDSPKLGKVSSRYFKTGTVVAGLALLTLISVAFLFTHWLTLSNEKQTDTSDQTLTTPDPPIQPITAGPTPKSSDRATSSVAEIASPKRDPSPDGDIPASGNGAKAGELSGPGGTKASRQQPETVLPYSLIAEQGRGAVFLYKTDSRGDIIEEELKAAVKKGTSSKTQPAGPRDDKAKVEGKNAPVRRRKETVRGLRWVDIMALYPHAEQVKAFRSALGTDELPEYAMVRVQRRELLSDGSFSDWAEIDYPRMQREVTRLLPGRWIKERPELEAAGAILSGLVMPLPELARGRWMSHSRMEAVDSAMKAKGSHASKTGGGTGDLSESTRKGAGEKNQNSAAAKLFTPGNNSVAGANSSVETNKSGNSGEQASEDANQLCTAEIVQLRFVDYTVEPEHTYQYRLKVVLKNPNHNRLDMDDAFTKLDILEADQWSDPTLPVHVPRDTEYYVLGRMKSRDEAFLQVHKWLADLGDWQVSDFTVKPGDPIGGEDLLLNVAGGDKAFTFTIDGSEIKYSERLPAEIFAIDRLGDIVTRNEDFDKYNADRKDREAELKKRKEAAEKESTKKRNADSVPAIPAPGGPNPPIPASDNAARFNGSIDELASFAGHKERITSVAISADGRKAAAVGLDPILRVWDVEKKQEIHSLKGHRDAIWSVALSSDARRALTGSGGILQKDPSSPMLPGNDFTVRLWDIENGRQLAQMVGHGNWVNCVAFSPIEQKALSGSSDATVRLWDLRTQQEIGALAAHTGPVRTVAFSPDGRYAVSGGDDMIVRVWDLWSGGQFRSLQGHTHYVTSVAFCPDNDHVLSASSDKTVRLWDIQGQREVHRMQGHSDVVWTVACSPDGRYALSGSGGAWKGANMWGGGSDFSIRLWDLSTGKQIGQSTGHASFVSSVVFCRDGRRALSGSWDKTVRFWNLGR